MHPSTDSHSPSIYYRKMGKGPVVLLVHGFPESSTLWRNIWNELARSYTLIMPDLPGSGRTALSCDMSIEDMAKTLRPILEYEGIDQVTIAGHSMGGYVALAFAQLYPEHVAGLSLVHSTPRADDEERKKVRQKAIEIIQKGGKRAFIDQMVTNLFADGFKQSRPEVVKEQVGQSLEIEEKGLVNFYAAMMNRPDRTGLLDKATFPVQWIAGMEDSVISYKKILEDCHRSGINFVSFYNNCGHMSMFEAPERLASDLDNFIGYCSSYQHKYA